MKPVEFQDLPASWARRGGMGVESIDVLLEPIALYFFFFCVCVCFFFLFFFGGGRWGGCHCLQLQGFRMYTFFYAFAQNCG